MALELQKQNYMTQIGSTPVVSSNATNASAAINIPFGQVEDSEYLVNNEVLNQPQTKRTVEELYNSISEVCRKYGLSLEEAKNIGLLSSISGRSTEELLNVDQIEINKIVEKLDNAINAINTDIDLKRNPEKLNFGLIKNYIQLFNGVVPKGWDSIESFRKAQQRKRNDGSTNAQSLTERLKLYGHNITPESSTIEKANALESYFDAYFESLEQAVDPITGKKRYTKDKVDNLQLTDFTKLLFNSSPEEYDMFRDAIEYLVVNNRCQGYKAILDSFETDAERTDFIKKAPEGYVEKVMTTPDQRGEVNTKEQVEDFVIIHTEYMDQETLIEYNKRSTDSALEFYTEENKAILDNIKNNPQILESIRAKIAKGENLTEEEQKIFEICTKDDFHQGNSSGQIIGTATNKVIDNNDIAEVLEVINSNVYEISQKAGEDFYKEVLQAVENYIAEHENELTMSKDSFVDLMNKATEGKYEKLVEPAVSQKEQTEASTQSTETSLGFANKKEKPVSTSLKEEIENNSYQEDTTPRIVRHDTTPTITLTRNSTLKDYSIKYGAYKGFATYAKEVGVAKALKEAFNNIQNSDKAQVKKAYKRQNTAKQADLIKNSGISSINTLLDWAKADAVQKLEGTILRTSFATKAKNEKIEEIKEEKETV